MKYDNKSGDVVTIHAELNGSKRCHKAWGKLPALQSASILNGAEELANNPWTPMPNCNNADRDTCKEEKHPRDEKGHEILLPLEAKLPFERPTPV